MEMLWGCYGGHMGSPWGHCGDAVGLLWGPYGVTMGSRHQVALRSLPEEAVKETLEYKVLQSQFSLLYHESLQVKTQLDEARALLLATKNSHLRHIEHMEVRGAAGGRGRGPQDGRRGAEVNGCWVGKMADWGLSNMADCWAAKMADCCLSNMTGCWVAKMADCWVSKMADWWLSKMADCWVAKMAD